MNPVAHGTEASLGGVRGSVEGAAAGEWIKQPIDPGVAMSTSRSLGTTAAIGSPIKETRGCDGGCSSLGSEARWRGR
jgi:hypothetical protein